MQIKVTSDGSHTLLNEELDETYHSEHGAIQESRHVFIDAGLQVWLSDASNATHLKVFEMGFGTGLNALLTWQKIQHHEDVAVDYTSIEAHPVPMDAIKALNYGPELVRFHDGPWGQSHKVDQRFSLHRFETKLEEYKPALPLFDLIYFDAFSPGKQPELWTQDVLTRIVSWMSPGSIFVTYSAKGDVKRALQAAGLEVELIPGPPGKREMIRARMA